MKMIKTAAAALALPGLLAAAVPATAAVSAGHGISAQDDSWQNNRRSSRYARDDYGRRGYDERRYRDRRDYRDYDRRYDCGRRKSGTTGLILGGAAGALLGREIDGGRDRTLGTIAGAAGGALLGREIDRGGSRCR